MGVPSVRASLRRGALRRAPRGRLGAVGAGRRAAGLILAVLLLPGLLAACGRGEPAPLPRGRLTIVTDRGPVVLRVEVAETPQARRRGLMGRPSLPEDAGMVFLFDRPTQGAFWMKDTLIPLSIAFWGQDGRIVAMLDMEPCRADPCLRYAPGVPYVGAVEVNLGFFERHGVEVGDRVELER
ncbi:MAG TPA: DUF192 domain-containing protein [Actinomycetota bacterium]|nr:DUF192 domain-containing protein [Actinomycetota bacterium]